MGRRYPKERPLKRTLAIRTKRCFPVGSDGKRPSFGLLSAKLWRKFPDLTPVNLQSSSAVSRFQRHVLVGTLAQERDDFCLKTET